MRAAVMGTGALGGFFGGLLARAGEDVTFIARGAQLDAIRARGLTVKSQWVGEFVVRAPVTDNPAEVGPVDLVLLGVKTYDLEAAAEQMRLLLGPETVVLPVQNGADIAERIGRILQMDCVLGGLTWVAAKVEAPGSITQTASSGSTMLVFGELSGGSSPRTEQLLRTLDGAGITAELHPNVRVPIWQKLVAVCANSGMTALTRLPLGPILACPERRAMYRGAMEEVALVARACGIDLPDGVAERTFSVMSSYPPTMRSSLANDLEAGRHLELEALNGTVVRLGREHGVPTPWNAAIYAALAPWAQGRPEPSV